MSLLEVEHLRKSFGRGPARQVVLRDVNLDVRRGECVVVIGGSGSGKSTLLRCLNLLETIDDGVIRLDGREISDPRVEVNGVRARIGLVFQAYNLFPHLRVIDNLILGPVQVHRMARERAVERAMSMLERVGLADKARAYPDQLSGGQQQRVAIARALVNSGPGDSGPDLLLLDEVTSALDPELVGEVLDLLRYLTSIGVTMIVNTHEMSFAKQVADTVCFLADGEIHESGPPAAVLEDPQRERTRRFLSRLL